MNSANLVKLEKAILKKVNIDQINAGSTVVTNLHHQQELVNTEHAVQLVIQGIDKGITNDLLAMVIPARPYHAMREKVAIGK